MSPRRLWLVLPVAAVTVGLLVLLARDERRARRAELHAEPAPVPGDSADALVAPAPAVQVEPARSAGEAPRAPSSANGPAFWTLRVLRAGEPDGQAELAWATREQLEGARASTPDPLERVKLAGKRAHADAGGEARIPHLAPGARVVAWDGPLLASQQVDEHTDSPVVLALELDRALAIRVRDELGTPAGAIPVGLRFESGRVERVLAGETDAQGLARFRHVGLGWGLDESTTGTAELRGIFDVPCEAAFTLHEWPHEPLELVLPAHGALVVEVLDEQGAPIDRAEREVELCLERERLPGAQIYLERERLQVALAGGKARFAPVGLGLAFTATLDDRPRHALARATVAGPTRAGEEVVVPLALTLPEVELLFRVLGPDGQPLAERDLETRVERQEAGSSFSSGDSLHTDAEGRARFALTERWNEGARLVLSVHFTDASGAESSGELDLSRRLPPGITDLGDLRLFPRALLVSGRVLDELGAGVGASLTVEASRAAAGGEASWDTRLWDSVQGDGRFALYDDAPAGALRLLIDADGFVPVAPIPFAPGTRDLLVTLARGGKLAGSVVLPPGMPAAVFWITAKRADGESVHTACPGADGRFEIGGLPAESLAVAFTLRPGSIPLFAVDGVALGDGETSGDPRLEGVDLARFARRILVRVHLSDGRPAQGGWVRAPGAGPDVWEEPAFVIENGESHVFVPRRALDLEINVPGFRVARLHGVEADQEVTLEPAFSVRCELAPEVELPAGSGSLQLALTPLGTEHAPPRNLALYRDEEQAGWWSPAFGGAANTFDARRELQIPVQELGAYELGFHLVFGSLEGGSISFEIPASEATRRLELDERSAGRTFVVAPDPVPYAMRLQGGR